MVIRQGTPEASTEGPADATSEATRYLCVAAHTDDTFADSALSEVFDDELRAVAPSVGFDLTTVLRHCLEARQRRIRRDAGLIIAGGMALLLAPLWTLLVAAVLAIVMSLTRTNRQGPLGPLVSVLALVAATVVSVWLLVQFVGIDTGEGESTLSWTVGLPWLALVAGLVAYLILVLHLFGTRQLLVERLRRGHFQPAASGTSPVPQRYAARLAAVDTAQHGNVTIYSGYTPFVGHGAPVAGWSFALPIHRAEPQLSGSSGADADVRFAVVDLIDHVRRRLAAIRLDPAGDPELNPERLAGLVLEDRVFVHGGLLSDDPQLLPDRGRMPRQRWSDERLRAVASRPQGAARHFLCALVPSWGGEVVACTFLHFSTDGRVLYLECARTLLEPPRIEYHDVDRLTEWLPVRQFVQLFTGAAEQLVRTALGAPVRLVRDGVRVVRHQIRQARSRRMAREDLGYDYGARAGVRELATGITYHNYFQVLDAAKHLKVVERHVLAAIVDFLEDRGVDTAEFRTRQTMILNQGVIQTGGLSVVGNQAVGAGARAEQQSTTEQPSPQGTSRRAGTGRPS
ncbi:hypothetical protein O3597_09915 [Verrucosispora sp. WMMA2044]|uniref:Uncharacterized protein n=1 Tax=Verrucosispora sioxanthis TaxID=2499994 RepID=A0A6M1LCT1_9ACTN|nr:MULTISPECIES: hypothetical protein [Micromonospora]NEE66907.1 hypothetical protein [Verrucosispora sioxanthis]NGM16017.1 hypothetical protein [Verrucosispora sioxanthis]WBB50750.1 hypothetical protein O3597_09915 [Verrucosispora sp. WMMA2044]